MSGFIEWSAIGNIIVVGLVFGAGLPALFALGVRALAGPGSHQDDGRVPLMRRVTAIACFAVIVVAVVGAIVYIAAGGH
jgi:hypothetical protein